MKAVHVLTWIPILGIILGLKYGYDSDSPVQTHTMGNAMVQGISLGFLIMILYIKVILI